MAAGMMAAIGTGGGAVAGIVDHSQANALECTKVAAAAATFFLLPKQKLLANRAGHQYFPAS
jgi:hypothetical protein